MQLIDPIKDLMKPNFNWRATVELQKEKNNSTGKSNRK